MLCFKCKQEIPDDTLRCPHCGIKVNMYCPECNTLNRFGSKYCIECGTELLKVCLNCGSNNLYYAKKCRKCETPFPDNENELINETPQTVETQEEKIVEEVQESKKPSLTEFIKSAETEEETKTEETINFIDIDSRKKEQETVQVKEESAVKQSEDLVFINPQEQNNENKEVAQPVIEPIKKETPVPPPMPRRRNNIQSCIMKPSPKRQGQENISGFGGKKQKDFEPIRDIILSNENDESEEENKPDLIILDSSEPEVNETEPSFQTIVDETSADEKKKVENNTSEEKTSDLVFLADMENTPVTSPEPQKEEDEPEVSEEEFFDSKIDAEVKDTVEETYDAPPLSAPHIQATIENSSFATALQSAVTSITTVPYKNITAISGDAGLGKSVLMKQILGTLSEKYSALQLYARCSQSTQVSALGTFQDAFLTLLGLSGFTSNNINAFIKGNKSSLKQAFPGLSDNEISDFVNFLYPNKTDNFSNINENKERLFTLIEKILTSLASNVEYFIFAIDNFDFIDGMSFELLTKMIDNDILDGKLRIIISYQEDKAAEGYFYSRNVNASTAKTIHLKPSTKNELKTFALQFLNNDENLFPNSLWETILTAAKNSTLNIENIIALLFETGVIFVDNNKLKLQQSNLTSPIPTSIEMLIKERLNLLMPQLRTALYTAAVLGYRFDNQIFAQCLNLTDNSMNAVLTQLKNILYIEDLTPYSSTFRSYTIWKIIEQEAKESGEYENIIKSTIAPLSQFIFSSPLYPITKFENYFDKNESFERLSGISGLISYLGDINLYTIAKKHQLKILSKSPEEANADSINAIYEEIGKLNYKNSPTEAITYLSNAIDYAQKTNNIIKAIDLCGYLVNSCYLTGNYYGAIEAVDLVIKNVNGEISELELALIKERKLKALYSIGNCEEIINLMTNEISSVLQEEIEKGFKDKNLKNLVNTAWINSNIILANAYAMQGDNMSFEVINEIKNYLGSLTEMEDYFTTKSMLTEALAFTSLGDLNNSNRILNDIANAYAQNEPESDLLSEWNLINLINKTLANSHISKEELFELATFANNTNEYFVKNIIKLILGYLIQKDGNAQKALGIYNEQITYFAKEKNAIGALLCWYLIAQSTLITEDADKALNIAQKALEVAQGPKINNFNFIIYLKKFIAEVYIIKGDLESAQMYLEEANTLAQQNGLLYAQFKIMLSYANFLEESIQIINAPESKAEIALEVVNVNTEALEIAKKLNLPNLIEDAKNAEAVFRTYCKLNNITLNINTNNQTVN